MPVDILREYYFSDSESSDGQISDTELCAKDDLFYLSQRHNVVIQKNSDQ